MKKYLVPVQVWGELVLEVSATSKANALRKAEEKSTYEVEDNLFNATKKHLAGGSRLTVKPIKSRITLKDDD